jgi:hypothetical protein
LNKRSKVAELRRALQEAVDMYHADKWDPYKGQGDVIEEYEEIFDLTGIEEEMNRKTYMRCDTIMSSLYQTP